MTKINDQAGTRNDALSSSSFSAPRSASASAPGKLILCGEHAVVYNRPAIALPLSQIRAQVTVAAGPPGTGLHLVAPDLDRIWSAAESPADPLCELAHATLLHLGFGAVDVRLTMLSTIPIASGMGSGAAIGAALVRALAAFLGRALDPAEVSALVYASEQRYHGTPSGIDNTVIAYEQAIWFQRPNATIEPITIAAPFTVIIGDTGMRCETRLPVGEVRRRWQADQATYEALFDQVGAVVTRVRDALAVGDFAALGVLLDANQSLLEQLGVSSPELEHLIMAVRNAGALGAKLSGGGWGGVMLALVDESSRERVAEALRQAGATQVLETRVEATLNETG
ncbi:MAG: mevalonate kinase [Chloroflexales bacterium]|nr:mevalonate kinase [Chloroflexales bacterium]